MLITIGWKWLKSTQKLTGSPLSGEKLTQLQPTLESSEWHGVCVHTFAAYNSIHFMYKNKNKVEWKGWSFGRGIGRGPNISYEHYPSLSIKQKPVWFVCDRIKNIVWEMHRLLWNMGMKRVSILGIWREMCTLYLPTFHANCWLIKWICWKIFFRQYDFWPSELHEKILTLHGKICLSSLFKKINWNYNLHDVSATIWDKNFLLNSDLYGSDRLHLDI